MSCFSIFHTNCNIRWICSVAFTIVNVRLGQKNSWRSGQLSATLSAFFVDLIVRFLYVCTHSTLSRNWLVLQMLDMLCWKYIRFRSHHHVFLVSNESIIGIQFKRVRQFEVPILTLMHTLLRVFMREPLKKQWTHFNHLNHNSSLTKTPLEKSIATMTKTALILFH